MLISTRKTETEPGGSCALDPQPETPLLTPDLLQLPQAPLGGTPDPEHCRPAATRLPGPRHRSRSSTSPLRASMAGRAEEAAMGRMRGAQSRQELGEAGAQGNSVFAEGGAMVGNRPGGRGPAWPGPEPKSRGRTTVLACTGPVGIGRRRGPWRFLGSGREGDPRTVSPCARCAHSLWRAALQTLLWNFLHS